MMYEDNIIQAKCTASSIASQLAGAMWSERHREFLLELSERDLRKLADLFGFELTPKHCPLTETISHAEAAQ